jgi:preprotein translocase subunit SecE
VKGLLEYLRNSRAELSRVTWPTRNEVIQATQATLFFVLLTAAFLLVADLVLGNGIRGLLRILQG